MNECLVLRADPQHVQPLRDIGAAHISLKLSRVERCGARYGPGRDQRIQPRGEPEPVARNPAEEFGKVVFKATGADVPTLAEADLEDDGDRVRIEMRRRDPLEV